MCAFRNFRRRADDIVPTDLKKLREQEYRAKADPFLFELIMQPRYVVKGQV